MSQARPTDVTMAGRLAIMMIETPNDRVEGRDAAIRLPYEYDAMAGVLFWTSPPPHCAAIRTAVFETRREAREAKKRCPAGSKVVHVKVTISETAMSSNV